MTRPRSFREDELQANIVKAARLFGWRHYHPYDSRRSVEGFPDLVLVRARLGEPKRLIFVELKQDGKQPTDNQQEWLNDLAVVARHVALSMNEPVIDVCVWRPADWLSGDIERVLRR